MTKNNLKVVKTAKDKDLENKEKNKALDAAIDQITDTVGKGVTRRQLQLLMANEKLNGLLDAVTGGETGEPKTRNLNEQYKGRDRYVPEHDKSGKPTGRYIDQKDPFGPRIDADQFGKSV